MARPRIIPDQTVFAQIRALIAQSGERAASFSAVARLTKLAAPTLVQRYGSQEGMVRAALIDGWDRADRALAAAEDQAELSAKGAQALLKSLAGDPELASDLALLAAELRDSALRARAASWRAEVERALAQRLGGGAKGREAAAILFAAWQGQLLWAAAGEKGFRLKDAVKRLI